MVRPVARRSYTRYTRGAFVLRWSFVFFAFVLRFLCICLAVSLHLSCVFFASEAHIRQTLQPTSPVHRTPQGPWSANPGRILAFARICPLVPS